MNSRKTSKFTKVFPLKVSSYTTPSCITEREIAVVNILFSCSNGHLEVVKMLIEDHHCDMNPQTGGGDTPLHYACK